MLANYLKDDKALVFYSYDCALSDNTQNIRNKIKKVVTIIENYQKSLEEYIMIYSKHQNQTILNPQ